jgi:hypothetical protein
LLAIGSLGAAGPLAGQQNPFAFTSPTVKSAHIVYDMSSQGKPVPGANLELGVTADRWVMRLVSPFDMGGKKDTIRSVVVETRDSVYRYNALGSGARDGEVSASLRPHLLRGYETLDGAGKARLRENLKLVSKGSDRGSDFDQLIAMVGEKTGAETVAGQRCDVYRRGDTVACVLPQAPGVPLKWTDKQGNTIVARKVTLNGPIPPAASVLPKGVKWKPDDDYEGGDFAMGLWEHKHPDATERPTPAQVAGFAVKYLASAQAAAELKEMGGGEEETGEEDTGDEEAVEE